MKNKTLIIILYLITLLITGCSIQMVPTETNVFSKEIDLVPLKSRALHKISLDYPLQEKHAVLLDYYYYDKSDEDILRYLILTSYYLQNIFDTKYYLDELLRINPANRFANQFKEQRSKELEIEYTYRIVESNNFRFYYPNPDIYNINITQADMYNSISSFAQKAEEKYVFISNDFNFNPREKITVIFYGSENYDELSNFNFKTAGFFDGKIRLNLNLLNHHYLLNIFIHETIHAIIYQKAGPNVPVWFHEGMAQYYENNKTFNIDIPNTVLLNFISIQELETSFNLIESTLVNQAYIQSLLLIKFLKEKYGANIVYELLDEFRKTKDYNAVYYNILLRERETLEQEYKSYISLYPKMN